MLICNNLNDTGSRIRRYYGGSVATNVTTLQNADSSALYFTQPVGIGGPVTTGMELEVIGSASCTSIFAKNLSCVNASFDTIWTNNLIVDPATEWHVSISNASIVSENVSYSIIYNLSCTNINVSRISCVSISSTTFIMHKYQ